MLTADSTTAVASLPPGSSTSLPALVDRASATLASAKSAAEILDAADLASVAYDAAKRAARFAKAKGAHDAVVAAVHRSQADALEIEAQAKRSLADEYDAAQERGEVAGPGGERSGREHSPAAPTVAEIGITRKQIHEARRLRDAEVNDPGVVKRTLTELVEAGDEPTKARLREAVVHAAKLGSQFGRTPKPHSTKHRPDPMRDDLLTIWDCCKQISEVMERREPSDLIQACHDAGERRRIMGAIDTGQGSLSRFIEEAAHA